MNIDLETLLCFTLHHRLFPLGDNEQTQNNLKPRKTLHVLLNVEKSHDYDRSENSHVWIRQWSVGHRNPGRRRPEAVYRGRVSFTKRMLIISEKELEMPILSFQLLIVNGIDKSTFGISSHVRSRLHSERTCGGGASQKVLLCSIISWR